jgi:hypothetical protein
VAASGSCRPSPARPWPVVDGEKVKPAVTVNVAFTGEGLAALGLPLDVLCRVFLPEFREGIANPARSRILRDTEGSDPASEDSGGTGNRRSTPSSWCRTASGSGAFDAACGAQRTLIDDTGGGVVRTTRQLEQVDTDPTATTSRSVSMTASRSRRSPGFPEMACRPASSSSVPEPLSDHSTDTGRAGESGPCRSAPFAGQPPSRITAAP